MSNLLIHATERLLSGTIDHRAIFGTYPDKPPSRAVDTRVTLWGKIVDRGWCPLLHGGRGLIRSPDDVTRMFL